MTDEQYEKVLKAIDECYWRSDMGGGQSVCGLHCLPCKRVIDRGQCTEIQKVLMED